MKSFYERSPNEYNDSRVLVLYNLTYFIVPATEDGIDDVNPYVAIASLLLIMMMLRSLYSCIIVINRAEDDDEDDGDDDDDDDDIYLHK